MIRFRPDQKVLLPDYLFHYTKSVAYQNWVKAQQRAVAQPNINAKLYGDELKIPLPPLDEQRRIAAILDKADELRTKRREAIAKHDTLAQSIFMDMFGENSESRASWATHSLKDLTTVSYAYG